MKSFFSHFIFGWLFFILFLGIPFVVNASTTDGIIQSPNQYAWGDQVGWVNFAAVGSNVHVTDTTLTGYFWDPIYGWTNLAPDHGGVINDGNGNLSGYAWSEGAGFINFSGVTINTSGVFSGIAQGDVYGKINFSCDHCSVITDWRPASVRNPPAGGSLSPAPVNNQPPATPPQTPTQLTPPVSIPPQTVTQTSPSSPSSFPVAPTSGGGTGQSSPTNFPTPNHVFVSVPSSNTASQQLSTYLVSSIKKISSHVYVGIKNVMTNPTGIVATRFLSTTGVLSGLVVTPSIFVGVSSFSDIWFAIVRALIILLEFFGLRRKNRPWGTVYDSVTKRPLDPVYVSLIDVLTGKEVASAVTDFDGRYGFLVKPGTYVLHAQKTDYVFPSVSMEGKSFDEVYNDIYISDHIVITEEGTTIIKNIPMDPIQFNWNEFAKRQMQVNKFVRGRDIAWARFSKILFSFGAVVSLLALFFVPVPYNFIIFAIYLFAYFLNYIVFPKKNSGICIERTTGRPLTYAIVSIWRQNETTPFTKKITDTYGAYYALVPNGIYYLTVEKKNEDGSYTLLSQTDTFAVRRGIINTNISA